MVYKVKNKQSGFGWSAKDKRRNVKEIVNLYNEGYTHKQISEKLNIGIDTVFVVLDLYKKDELSPYNLQSYHRRK